MICTPRTRLVRTIVSAAAASMLGFVVPARAADDTCHGSFPNFITDVCWSGMFPISIFGKAIANMGQADCSPSAGGGLCSCLGKGGSTAVGAPVGFYEYSRMVDVTYKPYCFPLLGGVTIDAGPGNMMHAPMPNRPTQQGRGQDKTWFGNVNYYVNPITTLLGALVDSDCTDNSAFDIAWISPLDPTWSDPQLNLLVTPYAFAFANPAAGAASAFDCVSATLGCPSSDMIWSSGCNGHALPFDGWIPTRVSGDQAGRQLTHRILGHMHSLGALWGQWGPDGLCGAFPQPIMDKRAYKTQRILYIRQTNKVNGVCADPIGRTTMGSGGFEVPVVGKDFSYLVVRKRDCCAGVSAK